MWRCVLTPHQVAVVVSWVVPQTQIASNALNIGNRVRHHCVPLPEKSVRKIYQRPEQVYILSQKSNIHYQSKWNSMKGPPPLIHNHIPAQHCMHVMDWELMNRFSQTCILENFMNNLSSQFNFYIYLGSSNDHFKWKSTCIPAHMGIYICFARIHIRNLAIWNCTFISELCVYIQFLSHSTVALLLVYKKNTDCLENQISTFWHTSYCTLICSVGEGKTTDNMRGITYCI